MAVAKITKRVVDRLEPQGCVWDTEIKGLGIRRHVTAQVHYLLRYRRLNGKQTFVRIGTHGSPWTVEAARKEARRLLGEVAIGKDPAKERKTDRKAAQQTSQFGDAVQTYLEHKRGGWKPGSF